MSSFTLTETLVIIALIGFLALSIIPILRLFQPTLQLNNITQEIVGDLRYLQQSAITEQKEYCLQFLPAEKRYYLQLCDNGIIKERDLPTEITFFSVDGFTNNEVRYNPYGAVREPGLIILQNTKNQQKIITIKASGFINVNE